MSERVLSLSAPLPYPLQQLALHEGLDHVVGGGEVPGLVGDVHRFEAGREGVLHMETTPGNLKSGLIH